MVQKNITAFQAAVAEANAKLKAVKIDGEAAIKAEDGEIRSLRTGPSRDLLWIVRALCIVSRFFVNLQHAFHADSPLRDFVFELLLALQGQHNLYKARFYTT